MKSNWIRKLIGGLSFTTALFVFQACYGTPQDSGLDVNIEGVVKSKTSGLPIKGIKVAVANNMQYQYTDENGKFSFYTEMLESLTLQFKDVDSSQNGIYKDKDTLLHNMSKKVYLDIMLEENK
jgi:putative lipoprotein (rSAM/lipoprotein system)